MTSYPRACKECGEKIYLTNPNKGDHVKCDHCGTKHRIGARPFLIKE